MNRSLKYLLKAIFSLMFIGGGINHFVQSEMYIKMMPHYLPWHEQLVFVSGVIEIALGVGLWIPKLTRYSAIGIILLLVAVFPANINMYLNAEQWAEMPEWGLLLRLPVQVVLIWWAWLYAKRESSLE